MVSYALKLYVKPSLVCMMNNLHNPISFLSVLHHLSRFFSFVLSTRYKVCHFATAVLFTHKIHTPTPPYTQLLALHGQRTKQHISEIHVFHWICVRIDDNEVDEGRMCFRSDRFEIFGTFIKNSFGWFRWNVLASKSQPLYHFVFILIDPARASLSLSKLVQMCVVYFGAAWCYTALLSYRIKRMRCGRKSKW